MHKYKLVATTSFGIESIVAHELKSLGYKDLVVENGKVMFHGDEGDIAKCNIWLRSADRLLIQMNEFVAQDFEDLYQGTLSVPWEELIPENGKMHVVGKSVKSKLFSVSDCQSIVKRAVVDGMKRKYQREMFDEDGPVYKIQISILKDVAYLTIDTSGEGLHKRGYRKGRGEAPLRETLAAAIVQISRWNSSRLFADPFCGSGTIAIEAALIGKNIAPGINRKFASEDWPGFDKSIWTRAREEAFSERKDADLEIIAFDIDKRVFNKARENAMNAGVEESILFQKKPVEEFSSKKKYGCIVCNPPYGERLNDKKYAEEVYGKMGKVFNKLDSWSYFILTSHPEFEKFFRRNSDKNRKLYNGKIKVHLHQYLGELPPRKIGDRY